MAGDDFALVIASETDWTWNLDAIVAAVADAWPEAQIYDRYPVKDSTCRAYIDLPDSISGMQLQLDDSGKMIRLEYGSPEGTAEFVTWILRRFPPPDEVTIQLFEWGEHPRVTPQTTVQDLLAIGP